MTNNSNFLHKHGYCLVKNFFSNEEVEKLRSFVLKYRSKNQDIYISNSDCGLANALLSKNYFKLLKEIIGEDLLYYLDSSLMTEEYEKISGSFHIDARDDNEDPNSTNYPVWRVGIYLQDHKNYSGGIKMIANSHKKYLTTSFKNFFTIIYKIYKNKIKFSFRAFLPSLEYVNIPSEAGDIIIWNGRTHHSGRFKRLKIFKNLSLHPFLERVLPKKFFLEQQKRLVIFQNWCLDTKISENYQKYRYSQIKSLEYWKNNRDNVNKFPILRFKNFSIKIKL